MTQFAVPEPVKGFRFDDDHLMSCFDFALPQIIETYASHFTTAFGLSQEIADRIRILCEYTIKGGKKNRGMLVVIGTRDLCQAKGVEFESKLSFSLALGWCIEIACFLIADDIMDQSETRRGQLCWYKRENVQLDAINDSFIIQSMVYFVLHEYCREQYWYLEVVELFRQVSLKTEMGQMLDLLSQPQGRKGPEVLETFSRERLNQIVDYKTAYYTFYVPFVCALVVSEMDGDKQRQIVERISIDLGRLFQTQDDFLDCFGDPQHIGKIGTDIQDHKCTWLLVNALELADMEQRKLLEENLGKEEESCVRKVKELYIHLGLEKTFTAFEDECYTSINRTIELNAESIPPILFSKILTKIYKRSK